MAVLKDTEKMFCAEAEDGTQVGMNCYGHVEIGIYGDWSQAETFMTWDDAVAMAHWILRNNARKELR